MPVAFDDHLSTMGSAPPPVDSSMSAARLIAVAITALVISFLVTDRTSAALEAGASTTAGELRTGSVNLGDDDEGRTLFDLSDLLPGRPVENCIEVTYTGSIFDGTVGLTVRGGGALAPHLVATIEAGRGGGFEECGGFRPDETLFQGTLEELLAAHGTTGIPLAAIEIDEAREERTFRIAFELRDGPDLEGLVAGADFQWSVEA